MKKLVFIALGIAALTVVSCRQEDEVFNSEDAQGLRVLESRKAASDSTNTHYGVFSQDLANDGDPAPPPIR